MAGSLGAALTPLPMLTVSLPLTDGAAVPELHFIPLWLSPEKDPPLGSVGAMAAGEDGAAEGKKMFEVHLKHDQNSPGTRPDLFITIVRKCE